DFQQWVLGNKSAKWVMGAVERQSDHYIFGHRVEDRCMGIIGYDDDCEGVFENELNARYEVGATIYGTEGIIEVNDNNLRYMTSSSGGWQTFTPREEERQGYGRAH